MGALFLYLDSTKCAIKVSVLHRNGTNMQQPSIKIASARPSLLELVFARDMAPGKYGDRKIVALFYYNCPREHYVFI